MSEKMVLEIVTVAMGVDVVWAATVAVLREGVKEK